MFTIGLLCFLRQKNTNTWHNINTTYRTKKKKLYGLENIEIIKEKYKNLIINIQISNLSNNFSNILHLPKKKSLGDDVERRKVKRKKNERK